MRLLVPVTIVVWVAVEATLLVRDAARGKGSTAKDRGTRSFLVVMCLFAFVAASAIAAWLRNDSQFRLGSGHLAIGVAFMWLGLALRVWAVVVLGSSFRTTVEVDAAQAVVDSGPYRWIRHPSYTGMLMIAAGYGVAIGNWLALTVLLVIPTAAVLRRIAVEEATLADVLGPPYVAYQHHTKRLLPGLY
ncbi:MAG TPA: isoprenylcysteine carboxylmethyltransferase family protein [Streptosporangiaceae bacterium]|nr:isoprenylcysteine carboxylmethyltransferase family protein [Streptosporangiaceae bacterium]